MAATLVFLLVSFLLPTQGIVTRQVWAPALDMMGTPSPDGRYLSYVNWTKGNLAVHDLMMHLDKSCSDGWPGIIPIKKIIVVNAVSMCTVASGRDEINFR